MDTNEITPLHKTKEVSTSTSPPISHQNRCSYTKNHFCNLIIIPAKTLLEKAIFATKKE
jgi:hypothetical protein